MNILAPLPARLGIEIVFDFVCPWCYLGVKRLSFLLARRQDLGVDLVWRPFTESGHATGRNVPRGLHDPQIRAEDRARRLYASITELGAGEGIVFNFPAIRRTPNSVDAHRLVRHAARFGASDVLVNKIFHAHFVEGADIGSHAKLAQLAAEQGMDPVITEVFLNSNEGTEFVHAENLHAHRLGINGVPCFLIDGEHAITGAQETEVLERLIDLASCTAREK